MQLFLCAKQACLMTVARLKNSFILIRMQTANENLIIEVIFIWILLF